MRYLALLTFAAFTLIFGVQCLRRARVVQANAIDEDAAEEIAEGRLFRALQARRHRFTRSKHYLWSIRMSGITALLMGLGVIAALLFGTPTW
jgi:hypothetical protein